MQLLAFDYGLKHIGVATGQSVTATATPLSILPAKDGTPDWGEIEKLLKEWQPDVVVVGLPLNMDDSESEMSARARKFAARIHGRFGVKVELVDERLSSFEAKIEDRGMETGEASRDKTIDAVAASLILQSWMNENL